LRSPRAELYLRLPRNRAAVAVNAAEITPDCGTRHPCGRQIVSHSTMRESTQRRRARCARDSRRASCPR
jgi:hypothetical protein